MKKLYVVGILLAFNLGCTRKSETTRVSVQIPSQFSAAEKISIASVSGGGEGGFNAFLNPTSLAGFNCFAVLVGAPDFSSKGSCETTDGYSFQVGQWAGGVAVGQQLQLDVRSGMDRDIVLVGFYADTMSDCYGLFSGSGDNSSLSEPFVLARTKRNLAPGSVQVSLASAFNATTPSLECEFSEGGENNKIFYGNGMDGDWSPTGGTYNLNYITGTTGRLLTSIGTVSDIIPSSLYPGAIEVQLAAATNWTASNIGSGDELMLYAMAGNNGCLPLYPGMAASGPVLAFQNGTPDKIHVKIGDDRYDQIAAASFTANANSSTSVGNFCRVLAIRVPHINIMDVSGATVVQQEPTGMGDLDQMNFFGTGIIVMRINQLIVNVASSVNFEVSGFGFNRGSTFQNAQGVGGWLQMNGSPLANEGAYGSIAGGGGGHGGSGGADVAGKGGGIVGDQYGCGDNIYYASMPCLFGKFFLGGGGATDTAPSGFESTGGGAILVFAKDVTNNGSANFWAQGTAGSGLDNGGGAGGSILFAAKNVNSSSSGGWNFNANGGDGSGVGGGGGGGRIHVKVENWLGGVHTAGHTILGGGGSGAHGTSGTCRSENFSELYSDGCTD